MNPKSKEQLGNSEVRITRLGMGGTALGGLYSDLSEDVAISAVHRALTLGVNLFDTAPLYGAGKSEARFGKALSSCARSSFVLATKVGYSLIPTTERQQDIFFPFENAPPLRPRFDFTYDATMRSLEESYKRLGIDRVDIVHIHDPDESYAEAMNGAYVALHQLRASGTIKAIGAGMNQAAMLVRFAEDGDFDCFLLAGRYTLLDQSALPELLPLCAKKQISVILGGPYNSGILATGASTQARFNYIEASPEIIQKVRSLEAVCARHSTPLKAAALQFPLAHPAVASVIPGARSAEEIEENFRLLSYPIPTGFWQELRQQKLICDEAPVPEPSVDRSEKG